MASIGQPVKRKEDHRFLTGRGRFTDDIVRPRQTHAYFIRSPYAHAKITTIEKSSAEQAEGVVAVYTGADLEGIGGLPCGWLIHSKDGSPMAEPPRPALVKEKALFVGDIVAVVVAETLAQAHHAAHLVYVDYDVLPAVASIEAAKDDGAPLVHDEAPGNRCFDWHVGEKEPVDAAFENAAHVVSLEVVNSRLIPNAIEPRAAIAEYDPSTDETTLWTTSQNPHLSRLLLGAFVLQLPEHKLRVIAPDVGGGFGSKINLYPEETVCVWAARKLGRPVRWTAERSESFQTDTHGRDHIDRARLALDAEGRFLALHVRNTANVGAYLGVFGTVVPTYLHGILFAGVYATPAIYVEVEAVFTNTAPVDAYRGAGRPEATYLLERLVDKAARELGMDPIEVRRKNMVKPDMFPYQTPVALEYDTGDFEACLDLALDKADYAGFEARRQEAKKRGKLRGIGVSTYIEACGLAPSALVGSLGARAGLYESATIRVHPTGSITVMTGSHAHGQGHETTFAQIVADQFGVDVDQVTVDHGDTAKVPFGMGTYGSRSLAVGGSALVKAADKIVAKGKKIAAHLLEAAEADIVFEDGNFTVTGTDRSKTFAEVALTAYVPHTYPIEDLEPGLQETAFYDPKNFTYPAGCHICELEVDPETGAIEICEIVIADDVGRVINPMIVEGQIHGGVAQGVGQALLEGCIYDEDGQLLTGSYMSYTMPRAADLPMMKVGNHVTHCTHNPHGAKGAGEVGSIGVTPAVINAVVDALRPVGVNDIEMPATPQRVWRAIQAAKAS